MALSPYFPADDYADEWKKTGQQAGDAYDQAKEGDQALARTITDAVPPLQPFLPTPDPVPRPAPPPPVEAPPVDPAQAAQLGAAPVQPVVPPPVSPPAPPTKQVEGGTTKTTNETTRVLPTKNEAGIQRELAASNEEAVKNAREAKDNAVAVAKENADAAQGVANIQAQHNLETQEKLQAYEAEVQRRQAVANDVEAQYKKQLDDFTNTDPRTRFWAKQSTTSKVESGIALLLGIVGGLNDGSNVGADHIRKAIDADQAQARYALEQKEKILDRSRGDVTEAKNDIARQKQLLDIRHAAALEATVAQATARGLRLGIPAAQIKANQGIQELQKDAIEKRQNYEAGLRAKVAHDVEQSTTYSMTQGGAGAGGGKPSESQAKMAIFGQDMLDELKRVGDGSMFTPALLKKMQRNASMSDAADKTAEKGMLGSAAVSVARGLGVVPANRYAGLNDREKAAASAFDNMVEKYTRVLTGAGMPEQEAKRESLLAAPSPDDSPAIIKEKIARMDANARRFVALAGSAGQTVAGINRAGPAVSPGAPPPAAAPAGAPRPPHEGEVRIAPNGIRGVFINGKWKVEK